MSSPYTGADSYAATITIPDDGDAEDAASVNVPFEALADRTEAIRLHTPRQAVLDVTATTLNAFTAPERCVSVTLEHWGGGGAGGGGGGGALTHTGVGGGAGAGAQMSRVTVPVTPGVSYDVTIGAGGIGGPLGGDGANGTAGTSGGDTTFAINGGATLATAKGAGHGQGGLYNVSDGAGPLTPGGASVAGGYRPPRTLTEGTASTVYAMAPGDGGEGIGDSSLGARDGMGSPQYPGGAGGSAIGAEGGGGGGGGGPGGPGGDGGGSGSYSTPAGAGGANTGAGGGGGYGASLTGNARPAKAGGNGGSGFCRIIWIEDSP